MVESATNGEGVRQRNLARLLRIVHLDGPVSRAALTEATGLNRSTIGDLVVELVTAGLVEERAPDPSRRVGRPSPVVVAHPAVVALYGGGGMAKVLPGPETAGFEKALAKFLKSEAST